MRTKTKNKGCTRRCMHCRRHWFNRIVRLNFVCKIGGRASTKTWNTTKTLTIQHSESNTLFWCEDSEKRHISWVKHNTWNWTELFQCPPPRLHLYFSCFSHYYCIIKLYNSAYYRRHWELFLLLINLIIFLIHQFILWSLETTKSNWETNFYI